MKKGELHWETLAKLIIMVVVLIIIIYLILVFRDRIYDLFGKLKENLI
ncbi:hypothetical protein HYX17_00785 [Candidatus Woesearchaeota archaeon]|nr:hypothetical protein [Candidatus Woesearchaeota archaeon]